MTGYKEGKGEAKQHRNRYVAEKGGTRQKEEHKDGKDGEGTRTRKGERM